jgi:hypothetical protein
MRFFPSASLRAGSALLLRMTPERSLNPNAIALTQSGVDIARIVRGWYNNLQTQITILRLKGGANCDPLKLPRRER